MTPSTVTINNNIIRMGLPNQRPLKKNCSKHFSIFENVSVSACTLCLSTHTHTQGLSSRAEEPPQCTVKLLKKLHDMFHFYYKSADTVLRVS